MRESIKSVAVCAFRVNLLGINAILLAKKFGDAASGFGVISGELRAFGRELRGEMEVLNEASIRLVELAAQQMRLARHQHLMRQAAGEESPLPALAMALDGQRRAHEHLHQSVALTLQRMAEYVALAYQSCLFGTVIARAARVEAAHAGSRGQVLTATSNEFAEHVAAVLTSLELLKQATGGRA